MRGSRGVVLGNLNINIAWKQVNEGIREMLAIPEIQNSIAAEHIADTPERYVKALKEYFSGCNEDPNEVLKKSFEEKSYNQMIFQNSIPFISHCAHHLAPFVGKVHFGYIPCNKITGLSKIVRLVDILARRPQIQEKLSQEIVDIFYSEINPKGCGVVIEAFHFCICSRGIKKIGSYTRTTALRGNFLDHDPTKLEFLNGAKRNDGEGLL